MKSDIYDYDYFESLPIKLFNQLPFTIVIFLNESRIKKEKIEDYTT